MNAPLASVFFFFSLLRVIYFRLRVTTAYLNVFVDLNHVFFFRRTHSDVRGVGLFFSPRSTGFLTVHRHPATEGCLENSSTPTPSSQLSQFGKADRIDTPFGHGVDVASFCSGMRDVKEREMAQRAEHVQLILQDAHEARESEALLRRKEIAQNAAFNTTFLGIMNQLAQVISEIKK